MDRWSRVKGPRPDEALIIPRIATRSDVTALVAPLEEVQRRNGYLVGTLVAIAASIAILGGAAVFATSGETARDEPAPDVDATFRTGIRRFAAGDTAGALVALQVGLAAAPDHAPSWRVVGLVHERRGEHGGARIAFERYLALAPSASDAASIRARLER
jgi:hypothetical protein